MTVRETKAWLSRAYMAEQEIQDLSRRAAQAYDDITRTSPSYDYRPESFAGSGNSNESKYIKYIEFSRRIDENIDRLYALKCEIDEAVNRVADARLRRLLKMRYIDFYTWERIAEELGYDVRWVYKLHSKALIEAAKQIFCN